MDGLQRKTPGELQAGRALEKEHENPAIVACDDAASKALATTRARAALLGCELHSLTDGGFLLCKWGGMARALPNLHAVVALLTQIGGRS